MIRCSDESMLSQDPALGVESRRMPCSAHHRVMLGLLCPARLSQIKSRSFGREKAIQLFGGWRAVPIRPSTTNGNCFRGRRTLLQDGSEFSFQPGMQKSVSTLLYSFGASLSSGRPKQGKQLCSLSWQVLVGLACRLIFSLPGPTRLRDGLRGASLVIPVVQAVRPA